MAPQNWPAYKQINVYLLKRLITITLQNGFMLYMYLGKTCPVSDLAPLHSSYNVSELAPLLRGYTALL